MSKEKKGKKGKKIFFIILVVVVLFIVIVAIASNSDSSSSDGSTKVAKDEVTTQNPDTYIDMEEYNKIQNGMTYKEVVKIIGCEGQVLSSYDAGSGAIIVYRWPSIDLGGGVTYGASITFDNDKVSSKMQTGLDIANDVSKANTVFN